MDREWAEKVYTTCTGGCGKSLEEEEIFYRENSISGEPEGYCEECWEEQERIDRLTK